MRRAQAQGAPAQGEPKTGGGGSKRSGKKKNKGVTTENDHLVSFLQQVSCERRSLPQCAEQPLCMERARACTCPALIPPSLPIPHPVKSLDGFDYGAGRHVG